MPKLSKKNREALIERQINAAVVGLQIPILKIPAIYKQGEALLESGVCADRAEFVQRFQEFAIANGEHLMPENIRFYYDALVAADKTWMAAIEVAYPAEWPGDVRYRAKSEGAPGTPLRAAHDAFKEARARFDAAGGWSVLQGRAWTP